MNLVLRISNYSRLFFDFLKNLYESRKIIWQMTKHDFKQEYFGSYLGIFWAFFHPLVNLFVLWFVFEKGFRSAPIENFPFVLWLICGLFPWQFISSSILHCMNSILASPYLVKKIVFRVSILPIIKINSMLVIHVFFLFVIVLLFIGNGFYPSWQWLQIPYYIFSAYILLLGMGWITSSIIIFFRDLSGIVSVILQLGFWLTPVFWSTKILPQNYVLVLKLNPVYYLIEGYRDSFINRVWFWEHPLWTFYYWFCTGLIFFLGAIIFRKLRPHFADVL